MLAVSPIIKTDQNFEKTDQKQINFSLNKRPKTDFLDQKNRLFVKIIRAEHSEANPCRAASFAKVRLGPCNSSFLIKAFLKALKHFAKIYRRTELCSIPQCVYCIKQNQSY